MSLRRTTGMPNHLPAITLSLLVCAALTSCEIVREVTRSPAQSSRAASRMSADCTVSDLLVPSCGAWWGVTPGAFTSTPKPKALAEFERKIGRPVDIYHAYHRSPDLFPTKQEIAIATEPGEERLLFLNWKPEMGHSWAEVAAGVPEVNKHIDRLSAYINKNYTKPFFLTIHHEPEEEVRPKPGSGYTAQDYADMFRYVVERLRSNGVHNAVTVMNFMGGPKYCVKPWFDELYPGDDVVDWIGYDPYAEEGTDTFDELVNLAYPWVKGWDGFYQWAKRNHPNKPLMLAEWGVTALPDDPRHKVEVFRSMAKHVQDYPKLKAFVYFSAPVSPKGDTTIDSTKAALKAYRKLSNVPYLNPPGPVYGKS